MQHSDGHSPASGRTAYMPFCESNTMKCNQGDADVFVSFFSSEQMGQCTISQWVVERCLLDCIYHQRPITNQHQMLMYRTEPKQTGSVDMVLIWFLAESNLVSVLVTHQSLVDWIGRRTHGRPRTKKHGLILHHFCVSWDVFSSDWGLKTNIMWCSNVGGGYTGYRALKFRHVSSFGNMKLPTEPVSWFSTEPWCSGISIS